jgi:phosphohistidine phosphatase
MDLILWRHCEAEDASPRGGDLARCLTTRGGKQAERMAEWLNQRLVESTRIVVSPALRCQQTAKALGRKFRTDEAIGADANVDGVLKVAGWPDASQAMLIVGHQPTLGLVASQLLTGSAQHWTIKKGAVWWLRQRPRADDGQVVLQAVQAPDGL